MDGVPILSMFPSGLPATELARIFWRLNSTSNVVLTEVEKGLSFDDAVRRAQNAGYCGKRSFNDLMDGLRGLKSGRARDYPDGITGEAGAGATHRDSPS